MDCMVCLSGCFCVLVTRVNPAKMAEPIDKLRYILAVDSRIPNYETTQ